LYSGASLLCMCYCVRFDYLRVISNWDILIKKFVDEDNLICVHLGLGAIIALDWVCVSFRKFKVSY
jgi:hypothetical protein